MKTTREGAFCAAFCAEKRPMGGQGYAKDHHKKLAPWTVLAYVCIRTLVHDQIILMKSSSLYTCLGSDIPSVGGPIPGPKAFWAWQAWPRLGRLRALRHSINPQPIWSLDGGRRCEDEGRRPGFHPSCPSRFRRNSNAGVAVGEALRFVPKLIARSRSTIQRLMCLTI